MPEVNLQIVILCVCERSEKSGIRVYTMHQSMARHSFWHFRYCYKQMPKCGNVTHKHFLNGTYLAFAETFLFPLRFTVQFPVVNKIAKV